MSLPRSSLSATPCLPTPSHRPPGCEDRLATFINPQLYPRAWMTWLLLVSHKGCLRAFGKYDRVTIPMESGGDRRSQSTLLDGCIRHCNRRCNRGYITGHLQFRWAEGDMGRCTGRNIGGQMFGNLVTATKCNAIGHSLKWLQIPGLSVLETHKHGVLFLLVI
jgi:hypothetical protein